jgi:hypothetical protein
MNPITQRVTFHSDVVAGDTAITMGIIKSHKISISVEPFSFKGIIIIIIGGYIFVCCRFIIQFIFRNDALISIRLDVCVFFLVLVVYIYIVILFCVLILLVNFFLQSSTEAI